MKKIKAMLPYLCVIALDFYLLPLLIKDTKTAMIMLLGIVPVICFVCSIIYGIKNSFYTLYTIFVAILFIPSIFIFYNSTAWVYIVGFGIIALAGNAIGMIFFKRSK